MLKQHKYYVYYDENKVYARMDMRPPVLVMECPNPQDAHDLVQSIVNPDNIHPSTLGQDGFLSQRFQERISPNCEATVKKAYGE